MRRTSSANLGRKRLGLEPLEAKRLLAGDVAVWVTSGGDLRIEGDGNDNAIEIRATDDVGRYLITGLDQGGAPTLIRGQSSFDATLVHDDFRIDLRGGENRLVLTGIMGSETADPKHLVVPDDLSIRADGLQPQEVVLERVSIGDDLDIRLPDGDDSVNISDVVVNDLVTIHTRRGSDKINVAQLQTGDTLRVYAGHDANAVALQELLIGDDLIVTGDDAGDTISIRSSQVADDTTVHGRGGNDAIAIENVKTGGDMRVTGDDGMIEIGLNGLTVAGDLLVDVDDATSVIVIRETMVNDDLLAYGSSGTDQFLISNTLVAELLLVETIGASDQVCLTQVGARSARVHLGLGNDQLDVVGLSTTEEARFDGSGGSDIAAADVLAIARDYHFAGFELRSGDPAACDEPRQPDEQ